MPKAWEPSASGETGGDGCGDHDSGHRYVDKDSGGGGAGGANKRCRRSVTTMPVPRPGIEVPVAEAVPIGGHPLVDALERLAALHKNGGLSEEEFCRAKARILG